MRLIDLDPHFFTMPGSPDYVGMTFVCPHCSNPDVRLGITFKEEIDRDSLPNTIHWARPEPKWHREGDDFETMTITPSIDASKYGQNHWHGFITGGEIKSC